MARSGRRRYTPASSPVSVPTSMSELLNLGSSCKTCTRSAGPSLAAQPAALTSCVSRTAFLFSRSHDAITLVRSMVKFNVAREAFHSSAQISIGGCRRCESSVRHDRSIPAAESCTCGWSRSDREMMPRSFRLSSVKYSFKHCLSVDRCCSARKYMSVVTRTTEPSRSSRRITSFKRGARHAGLLFDLFQIRRRQRLFAEDFFDLVHQRLFLAAELDAGDWQGAAGCLPWRSVFLRSWCRRQRGKSSATIRKPACRAILPCPSRARADDRRENPLMLDDLFLMRRHFCSVV